MPPRWFMYVLQCSDDSLYCGTTTDVHRRLAEHNSSPRGAKYTRSRRPVVLLHSEECLNRSDALKKENAFKSLDKKRKLLYVESARTHI